MMMVMLLKWPRVCSKGSGGSRKMQGPQMAFASGLPFLPLEGGSEPGEGLAAALRGPFPGCARAAEQLRSPLPAGGNCHRRVYRARLRGKPRLLVVMPCGSSLLSPALGLGSESTQLIFSNNF